MYSGSSLDSPYQLPLRQQGRAGECLLPAGSSGDASETPDARADRCCTGLWPGPRAAYVLLVIACGAVTAWNTHALVQRASIRRTSTWGGCIPGAPVVTAAVDNPRAQLHGGNDYSSSGCRPNAAALLHVAGQLAANLTADVLRRARLSNPWLSQPADTPSQSSQGPDLTQVKQNGSVSNATTDSGRALHWVAHDERHSSLRSADSYDGGITVEESGYYFAYSQATFVIELEDAWERLVPLDHMLVRTRNDLKETLAKAQRTLCWNTKNSVLKSQGYTMASSFTGLIVHLQRGDSLSVGVNYREYIWSGRSKTFFGAYFLSR